MYRSRRTDAGCVALEFNNYVEATTLAPTTPLSVHFGWSLCVDRFEAALADPAAQLANVIASRMTGHHRLPCRVSLLDAAVLGGHGKLAASLREAGVESALGPDLPAYFLFENTSEKITLHGDSIWAAEEAGIQVDEVDLEMLHIRFAFPMSKRTKRFRLLDIALCLGHVDLAQQLVTHAALTLGIYAVSSNLDESHFRCEESLFPVYFWRQDKKTELAKANSQQRREAASATAQVVKHELSRVSSSYVLLLAQWGRFWYRDLDGRVEIQHRNLLFVIFEYGCPHTLLPLFELADKPLRFTRDE